MSKNIDIISFSDISVDPRVFRQVKLTSEAGFNVNVYCINNVHNLNFGPKVNIHEFAARRVTKSLIENLKNYILFFLFIIIEINIKSKNRLCKATIYNNMPNFLVFSSLGRRYKSGKVILDIHDSMIDIFRSGNNTNKFSIKKTFISTLLRIEEKLSVKLCNEVITVNHCIAKDIKRRNNINKVHLIHNVQDEFLFYQVFYKKDPDYINFVHHGNINMQNGIQNSLGILDSVPNLRKFHVIGDGVYLPKLKATIQKQSLQDNFQFTGAFKISELEKYLPENAIALITPDQTPQMHQALHVKVLDYCILGIPIICRRLSTLEYYFGSDTIYFFDDVKEIPHIVQKICKQSRDTLERIHRAQLIVQKLSSVSESERFMTLLE